MFRESFPLSSMNLFVLGISVSLFLASFFVIGAIYAQDKLLKTDESLLYENYKFSYQINYPTNWILNNQSSDDVYVSHYSDNNTLHNDAYLRILSVSNMSADLNTISNNTIDRYEVTYGSIESNRFTLSGAESRILYYNMSDERGQNRTIMKVLAMRSGNFYSLSYSADQLVYGTYLPTVNNMLQSFKIIDFLPYEDPSLGIKIKYPSNWNKTSFANNYMNGINFTSPSIKSLENEKISVSISRKENVFHESLDEVTNRTIDNYNETMKAFSLITNPVSLNSSDDKSNIMLFSYEDDMLGTIKVLEKNIIHGKWIYSLQYKADETKFREYFPILTLLNESFRIIDFLPYEDPSRGFKIEYPSNWDPTPEENGIRFSSSQESDTDFKDNFKISVYHSGNYSLHDLEFGVNHMPNAVNITSPTTTTIAGYPAKEIRTSFLLSKGTGQNLTADDIITVINHRLYELILYSEPSSHPIYLPTIERMINSFKILNFTLYQNPNLQFQMSFPSDWKIREDIDKVKFTSSPENQSDIFREYVAVRSPVVLSGNYTRDSYLHGLISNLKMEYARENLQINQTNSLDTTFVTLQFNFTSDYKQINAVGVFPVFNNKLYPIFFYAEASSYESYLSIISYMINSFKKVDFSSFRDRNFGLIEYPSHWEIKENNSKVEFYSPWDSDNDAFKEHFDISYTPFHALVNESIGCSPERKDKHDIGSTSEYKLFTTLGNPIQESRKVSRYSDGINNFKKMSIFINCDERLFTLDFYAEASKYESYFPIINYMINSFKKIDFKSYNKLLPFDHNLARLMYPSEWNVTGQQNSGFIIESPSDADYVSFSINAYMPSSTLEEDVSSTLNTIKQNFTDFKLLKSSQSTLLNHTSYEIVYSYTGLSRGGENTTFIEKSEFASFGTLGYEIDYIAEAEKYYSYLPVIEKMLSAESFVIKPTGLYPPNSSGLLFDSPIIDLAVNPSTHKVYLSSDVANRVFVLDELTGKMLTNITVNGLPNFVSVHPYANKIYVVSPEFNQIYVINGYTDNITSIIKAGRNPAQLALDPTDYTSSGSKGLLFVANQDDNDVWIIDASSEVPLGKVPVGNSPYGIAVNPITTRAYVTSLNELSVIDYSYKNHTVFSKVIARMNLLSPVGIAVDPYKNHIFVGSTFGNVSEIDGVTNKVIKNFRVGILPQYLAFNRNNSELYITDSGNNTISILNVSQSSPKPISLPIDGTPSDIDVDPIDNWILTSSASSRSITFINGVPPHNRMVHVGFDTNPYSSVQIKCKDKIVPLHKIVKVGVGSTCSVEELKDFDFSGWSERFLNNVVEFSQHKFKNSTYFPSNSTFVSDNTTIMMRANSILTANFHHRDTIVDWIERLGPLLSTISLAAVIVIASVSQYLFGYRRKGELKSDHKDWIMDRIDLITIDASVVVGVLVFLSLEGFSKSQQTQVTLVTANIVFPFAISAIFSVVNRVAFGTRLMVAGFVNLMMSIIIIAIIKLNS